MSSLGVAQDLWNIKYLHRFKWSHLTEKMAYEARVKRDKLRIARDEERTALVPDGEHLAAALACTARKRPLVRRLRLGQCRTHHRQLRL